MIPNEFINDLLNRVDIVDVVGQYVQLKRAGANHQGLCPFHNEKSPSFTVSAFKQFYHCFGCGAHGTAVGFLMEHNGLTFVEAINDLARQAGMTVPQDKPQSPQQIQAQIAQKVRTQNLGQVLTEAATFYKQQLREHPHAIAYLKRRGLSGDIAQRFGLGFAPFEPTLSSVFDDYNESSSLLDAGLCKQREGQNRRYDFFRERIMFPIRNTKGQIIGFGGRVLDKSEPKYLNSPETPLFQKGQELYGLFEARSAISQQQYALIVEGYMDVVALAQAGLANAVATLGTATSTAHVQKLFRFTDTIVFSFDGDSAGRKAAWRAMINALPLATDTRTIKFLFLPPEHDPDTFVREKGADAFAAEVQTAMTLSQFLLFGLNQAAPDGSAEARARQLHLAKPLLQSLPNGALRTHIIQALAAQLNSTPSDVSEYCELNAALRPRKNAREKTKRIAPPTSVERALDLLVAHPQIASHANPHVWQHLPQHQALTHLIELLQAQLHLSPAALQLQLEQSDYADWYQYYLQKHLREPAPMSEEDATTAYIAIEKQLERDALDAALKQLAQKMTADTSVKAEYTRLLRERAKLNNAS
ncbi:DNA primase [Hydromonas duriensis]|uniref:DNA primase n=1 Tax=Hydromonas duriensis TaxID=1527608 RepID=A0A4R6Y9V2_9BURK|nr:DNA primase [Hydromonas duriensis]TDR32300.1 DNA primase [Hydromonas duriensis]